MYGQINLPNYQQNIFYSISFLPKKMTRLRFHLALAKSFDLELGS